MATNNVIAAAVVAGMVLLGLPLTTVAVTPGFKLTGLALHQETGRDIYLGGLYLEGGATDQGAALDASTPNIMEYRVIARRTSMRSLLGGMLLQSEMAAGQAPDAETTSFANQVLSNVRGSLYAGDSFEIRLDAAGTTSARLNDQELATIASPAVAHYFLMGWMNERGPSTTFRESLLAATLEPALLAKLEDQKYSDARGNEVAAWFTAPVPQTDAAADDRNEPVIDTVIAPEGATIPVDNAAVAIEMAAASVTARPETAVSVPNPEPMAEIIPPAPIPREPAASEPTAREQVAANPVEDTVQLASLTPMAGMVSETKALEAFDIKEYSRRVSTFHKQLVAMVYGEIKYPRRAVRREMQGRVELDITLNESGGLIAVDLVQSSGHKILDEAGLSAAAEALAAGSLDNVDPMAAAEFRSEIADGQLVVPVPIMFMLTQR